eukprot:5938_1
MTSMQLKDNTLSTRRGELDTLLVFGYIRSHEKAKDVTIPEDIANLCFQFFHLLAEILIFSHEHISATGIKLSMDKTEVTKKSSSHKYVLTTLDPVFEGVHCWRCLTFNPQLAWIMWAVSQKRIFSDFSYDHAWGISYDNQWFPWNRELRNNGVENNKINLHHFKCVKSEVDMLFDVDKRVLKICKVGNCTDKKIAVISKIKYPDDDQHGFVPHVNLGTSLDSAIKMQMAKIPVEWFGQHIDDIFTMKI